MSHTPKSPLGVKIFCAVDTGDFGVALELAKTVGPVTKGIKLGMEFFNAFGPEGVLKIQEASPDAALFIDLKYHDIPNTVAGAVRSICSVVTPVYLNLHATGGMEMMKAAKEACAPETKMLAVTVLTSLGQSDLNDIGVNDEPVTQVTRLAKLAQDSHMDGIVCSAQELSVLRPQMRDDFVFMIPGIRPTSAAMGDQKRTMTPKDALAAGATHLVIGRPITQADDPAQAAQDILNSL